MEYVNLLWCWLDDNSGQVQILIAIGAICLAWNAYKGVLTQINMAEDQAREAVEQTKHFAQQVQEAAKQTQFAAEQLENSNKQVDTLIEHRDLILKIRDGELKEDYIKACVDAISILQNAISLLEDVKAGISKKVEIIDYDEITLKAIDLNTTEMDTNLKDFENNIKHLIRISADIVQGGDVTVEDMQKNIYTINLMKLRALRSSYIYPKFNDNLNRGINFNNFR